MLGFKILALRAYMARLAKPPALRKLNQRFRPTKSVEFVWPDWFRIQDTRARRKSLSVTFSTLARNEEIARTCAQHAVKDGAAYSFWRATRAQLRSNCAMKPPCGVQFITILW